MLIALKLLYLNNLVITQSFSVVIILLYIGFLNSSIFFFVNIVFLFYFLFSSIIESLCLVLSASTSGGRSGQVDTGIPDFCNKIKKILSH